MYGERRRRARARLAGAILTIVVWSASGCASDDDSIKDPDSITLPPATLVPPPPNQATNPATIATATTPSAAGRPAPTGSNGTPQAVTVEALDNNFVARELEVRAGTEVIWLNAGRNDHDVIPADDLHGTTWGVALGDFAPGERYSHVFSTPGTFVYVCTIHGKVIEGSAKGMVGVVTVTP